MINILTKTEILNTIPVLPTSDIERDIVWYKEKMGLELHFGDNMYAVLYRDNLCLHLQWHADTEDDPRLGGSVIEIMSRTFNRFLKSFSKEKR